MALHPAHPASFHPHDPLKVHLPVALLVLLVTTDDTCFTPELTTLTARVRPHRRPSSSSIPLSTSMTRAHVPYLLFPLDDSSWLCWCGCS